MTYKISNKYHPYGSYEDGTVINSETGEVVNQFLHNTNYFYVSLPKGSRQRTVSVHRIVADAWCHNDGYNQVNHINGVKTDNRACNLEWCSHSYNIKHSYDTGLRRRNMTPKGQDHSSSVRTNEEVHKICKFLEDGGRVKDAAEIFGLHRSYISNIRDGFCWSHVSSQYDFPRLKGHRTSESTVRWICNELVEGKRIVDIAKNCRNPSVTQSTIKNIKYKKTFRLISKDYF